MLRFTTLAMAALVSTLPLAAQPATNASYSRASGLGVVRYDVDPSHSAIEFSVRFMGLSRVRGAFTEFSGTLMYDSTDVTRSSISVAIGVASINTNSSFRDRDLKGPSFFDADKFPRIGFRSTRIERTAAGLVLHGAFTMRGLTRNIAFPIVQVHPEAKDAWENRRVGWSGSLTLSRREYGIMGSAFWNNEFDPGRLSIGDEVTIELLISAGVSNVDRWTIPRADSVRSAAERQGVAATLTQYRAAARDTASPAAKSPDQILGTVGMKLMHHQKFADAVPFFQLASELKPDLALVHAALGEALLLSGKKAEATASFRRALAIDSLNTVASEYLRRLAP